jgi:hypothetical protein
MPVVLPADEAPAAASEQEAAFVPPLLTGHFYRGKPAREQASLAPG